MAEMELFWGFLYTGVIAITAFSLGYIAGHGRGRKDKEADHE